VMRASHSSTPENESEGHKAERPPKDEAENHQCDPSRLSEFVELIYDHHGGTSL
jgi:hypothetical protein